MRRNRRVKEKEHGDKMTRIDRAEPAAFGRWRSSGLVLLGLALALWTGSPRSVAAADQMVFVSPEAAADALAAAWRSGSRRQLLAIFGRAGDRLISSGDPVAEKQARERLASAYAEEHHFESEGPLKATVVLGKDEWPYPIPLVKGSTGWRFDVKAGAEQIIERRIGRNELNAIAVCRSYVEAQGELASRDWRGDGVHDYALRILSSDGKHDGLYWPARQGAEESPLGSLVAAAEGQGYGAESAKGRAPFHGYFYKILTRQGKDTPGGERDYIVGGRLTGGFALVAFPARYGDSGVMTFVVNQSGIVFEKNLGPDTARIARRMTVYNPDESWKIAQP